MGRKEFWLSNETLSCKIKNQAYCSYVGLLIPKQNTSFGIVANTEIAIFRRVSKSHSVTFLAGLLTSFIVNVKEYWGQIPLRGVVSVKIT